MSDEDERLLKITLEEMESAIGNSGNEEGQNKKKAEVTALSESLKSELSAKGKTPREALNEVLQKCQSTDPLFCLALKILLVGGNSASLADNEAVLKSISLPAVTCGRNVPSCEFLWICETCTTKKSESCFPCYCNPCFRKELHVNHKYYYHLGSESATCDCGDEGWLSASSFCEKHRVKGGSIDLEQLLPAYNRTITKELINELQRICSKNLAEVLIGKEYDCYSQFKTVKSIWRLFQELIKLSPAFIKMIASSFECCFPDISTIHNCSVASVESATVPASAPHPCSCSVLDNLCKHLIEVGRNSEFATWFSELSRLSEAFAASFLEAFLKNYCFVFSNTTFDEQRTQILYKMLWQSSIEFKVPKAIVPKHSMNYIYALRHCIDSIKKLEQLKTTKYSYYLMYDFISFLNYEFCMGDYFIKNNDFFAAFLSALAEIEFSNSLEIRGIFVENDQLGFASHNVMACEYFMRIFSFMIRGYNMKSFELNNQLFRAFKASLSKMISETKNVEALNSLNIPLLRMFSVSLNKYIYQNFNYDALSGYKAFLSSVTNSLMLAMDIKSVEEFHQFIADILKRVIRVHNFFAEAESNIWVYYGIELIQIVDFTHDQYRIAFVVPDIALIQNLLPLLPSDSFDILALSEFFIDFAHSEHWQKKAQADIEKIKRMQDHKFQRLSCMLFNSDCRLLCLFNALPEAEFEERKAMFEHAVKKEIVRLLFRDEDVHARYEHIDLRELAKAVPNFLRGKSLNGVIESFLFKKPNNELSIAAPGPLMYYDVLAHLQIKHLTGSEINIKSIINKMKDTTFDPLRPGPRMKDDMWIHQGIINSLNKDALIRDMQKIIEGKGDTEIIRIMFLKLMYEILHSGDILPDKADSIKHTVTAMTKDWKLDNALYMNSIAGICAGKSPAKTDPVKATDDKISEEEKKRKAEIKKKVLEEYKERQRAFAKKNSLDLTAAKSQAEKPGQPSSFDQICNVCKEKLDLSKPYGIICYIGRTRKYQKYLQKACDSVKTHCKASLEKTDLALLQDSDTDEGIASCGHFMHIACYKLYRKDFCPACKSPINAILANLKSKCTVEDPEWRKTFIKLFDNSIDNEDDPTEMFERFKYLLIKQITLGLVNLPEFLRKKYTELKYFCYTLSVYATTKQENAANGAGDIPSMFTPLKDRAYKPHMESLLSYMLTAEITLNPEQVAFLKKLAADSAINSICWVLLRGYQYENDCLKQFLEKTDSGNGSPLLALPNEKKLQDDIVGILLETAIALSLIMGWDEDTLQKCVALPQSESFLAIIQGFTKLISSESSKNLVLLAKENLIAKETLAGKSGLTVNLKQLKEDYNNEEKMKQILLQLVSVSQGSISILMDLPANFCELQLEYYAKKPEIETKDKILCLICGSIICGGQEDITVHTKSCNSDSVTCDVFAHSHKTH